MAKTGIWLGGVALHITNFEWVMRLGCDALDQVLWQPTHMEPLLRPLLQHDEGGVTLRIVGADDEKSVVIDGVHVLSIERVDATEDAPSGLHVRLADRRVRLRNAIMTRSWGLVYQGQYLEGTAATRLQAYTLEEGLELLFGEDPFDGHMKPGWERVLENLGELSRIPDRLLYAGQNLVETLDNLLAWWGFALGVNYLGQFYLADSGVVTMPPVPGTEDPGVVDAGLASLLARVDELEFKDWDPSLALRAHARLPGVVKVPFWEDHNIVVPKLPDAPALANAVLRRLSQEGKLLYGLGTRNVYRALGTFYARKELLAVYGYGYHAGPAPHRVDDTPFERYASRTWAGTPLHLYGPVTAAGNVTEQQKYEARFTLKEIIEDCERKYFALVTLPDIESRSTSSDPRGDTVIGPPGQRQAWTNLELGFRDATGNVRPRKPVGDWTSLPEEPEVAFKVWTEVKDTLDEWKGAFGQLFIDRREDAAVIFIRHKLSDRLTDPTGVPLPPDVAPGGAPRDRDAEPDDGAPAEGSRDAVHDKLLTMQNRMRGEAAPFAAVWAHRESGVFRLEQDRRRVPTGSDAVIGLPVDGHPASAIISTDEWLSSGGWNRVPEEIRRSREGMKELATQFVENHRPEIRWDQDYNFYVFATARRNHPGGADKFWVEEVRVGEGDEELWLEADDRVTAIRDVVNIWNPLELPGTETERPNGNDGFGRLMNRSEVRQSARRRASMAMIALTEPSAWSRRALAFDVAARLELQGSLDSISIIVDGWRVEAEITTGRRAGNAAQVSEARMRATRQEAEMAGVPWRR